MTDPNTRRRFIHQATAAGLAISLGGQARSQADWPQALVRMIVPYPVGGATDILARLIGRGIAARLGQQLLIDNRAGAGGMIGIGALAKSAPDGHTFGIIGVTQMITAPFLFEKVPYDTDRDISFVTLLATVPMVLAELLWGGYAAIEWSPKNYGMVLYVALGPALLAYLCYQQAVLRTGSQLPMFFLNLTPIFAALMAVILLGEFPELYHVVGLVLIVLGIVLANLSKK